MKTRLLPPACKAAVLSLVATSVGPPLSGVQISGFTESGMAFSGLYAGIADTVLNLRPEETGRGPGIGIPVGIIQSLSIELNGGDPDPAILESLLPVLNHLDAGTVEWLLAWLESQARDGNWRTVYRWADLFAELPAPLAEALKVRILKARSLWGLGLYRRLEKELEALNRTVPPIEAPLGLCRLNALALMRANHPGEALFWAALPGLRIPVAVGPAARELEALADELRRAHDSTIQP